MMRLVTLCVAVALLAGCRGQARPPSPEDPFLFGPTRVPPPGTGATTGRPADPYYRGIAPRAQPPSVHPQGVPPVGASSANTVSPPQRLSVAIRPERTATASADAGLLAGRDRVVRILPPRTGAAPLAEPRGTSGSTPPDARARGSSFGSAPSRSPRRRVDISELPPVGGSRSASQQRRDGDPAGFRLVSASEEEGRAGESARVEPAVATQAVSPQSLYGHADDYSWVRGKLEHSQLDGRWKLRYIPIDGQTDEYGGSVVVSDPAVLSGCERGQFIELRGEVAAADPDDGFAPLYEVAKVERLGQSR